MFFFAFNAYAQASYFHQFSNHSEIARVIIRSGSYSINVKAEVYSSTNGKGSLLDREMLTKKVATSENYTYTATATYASSQSGRYYCQAANNNVSSDQFNVSGVN